MIIQPTIKKKECPLDIIIDKEHITIMNSYKYLDYKLNFDIHIENIKSKISIGIGGESYGSSVRFSIKDSSYYILRISAPILALWYYYLGINL